MTRREREKMTPVEILPDDEAALVRARMRAEAQRRLDDVNRGLFGTGIEHSISEPAKARALLVVSRVLARALGAALNGEGGSGRIAALLDEAFSVWSGGASLFVSRDARQGDGTPAAPAHTAPTKARPVLEQVTVLEQVGTDLRALAATVKDADLAKRIQGIADVATALAQTLPDRHAVPW
jgi:hypothetical protein